MAKILLIDVNEAFSSRLKKAISGICYDVTIADTIPNVEIQTLFDVIVLPLSDNVLHNNELINQLSSLTQVILVMPSSFIKSRLKLGPLLYDIISYDRVDAASLERAIKHAVTSRQLENELHQIEHELDCIKCLTFSYK